MRAIGDIDSPAIDWRLAAEIQRTRRSAATRAGGGRKLTRIKDAGPGAYFFARAAAAADVQRARDACHVEQAKLALQRRGRVVYRASVTGGPHDRWFVSGLGPEATDEELVAEAARTAA